MGRRAGRSQEQLEMIASPAPARSEPTHRGRTLRGHITLSRDGNIHVEIEQPKGEAEPLIPSIQRHRCRMPTCLRWCYAGALGGARTLGLSDDAFCGSCVDTLVLQCLEVHGRLPARGEFFCRTCARIREAGDRTPADADGRQRLACRQCRRAQVQRAGERRRRRERRSARV